MNVENLIIDGTNIEYRTYFIARKEKKTSESGLRIELVDKFLESFRRLVKQFDPNNIYVCWDKRIDYKSKNFRQILLDDQYKAGRVKHEDISEMYEQEELLHIMLTLFGAKNLFPNKLEADDVASWLTTKLNGETVIVSVDKDYLQLVQPHVSIYNLKTLITYNNFEDNIGMLPEHHLFYKAIKGDSSDNIPGVKGYGEVKSTRLAKDWSRNVLTKEDNEIVSRNLTLMDLAEGFKKEEGEEESYTEQFNAHKGTNGNIKKFLRAVEVLGLSEEQHISEWKSIFRRNTLVDLINSLE